MQKILEGALPAVLFIYLISALVLGSSTFLAATLPAFTVFFAIFGAGVIWNSILIRPDEKNSRVRNQ